MPRKGEYAPVLPRLLARTVDVDGCKVWTGYTVGGYGRLCIEGRDTLIHVWAWEQAHGPVPEGLELDHTCRRRACWNDEHLEPVTRRENVQRGLKGVLRTHCKHGHLLDEANTYRHNGRRYCRECNRDADRSRSPRTGRKRQRS